MMDDKNYIIELIVRIDGVEKVVMDNPIIENLSYIFYNRQIIRIVK